MEKALSIKNATGKIEFKMTNNGMFHLVLQESDLVLKGLISAMLHIPLKNIKSAVIENPILQGDNIGDKTFILDVKVRLDTGTIVNLEMQVLDQGNWTNRSLSYLSRSFDQLQRGQDYNSVSPVIHIGFLDFDLFEDDEEFYAEYQMMNIRTHRLYNSNFRLNVLSLKRIENATVEDKAWNIDKWAELFKAKTWEELRMVAQYDQAFLEAAERILANNTEENRRWLFIAFQDAENHEKRMKKEIKELSEQNAELSEQNAELNEQLSELSEQLRDKDALIERLKRELQVVKG